MNAIIDQLSEYEKHSLEMHEDTIDRGIKASVAGWHSLKAIDKERLYRATHKTFEKYAKERWGISRPRAYQYIKCAEVHTDLSRILDKNTADRFNAAHLTELSRANDEQLKPIAKSLAKKLNRGETITAAIVEAEVSKFTGPKPKKNKVKADSSSATAPAAEAPESETSDSDSGEENLIGQIRSLLQRCSAAQLIACKDLIDDLLNVEVAA